VALGARERRRNQRAGARRSGLAWAVVSTTLLAATGFAVGLLVGAVWETPEKILPLVTGRGQPGRNRVNCTAPSGDGSGAFHYPVLAAGPVAETTGAGDAFNGGLAAALAGGLGRDQAIRHGIATACLSVTRPGAARSMPASDEIAALLARHDFT